MSCHQACSMTTTARGADDSSSLRRNTISLMRSSIADALKGHDRKLRFDDGGVYEVG